MTVAFNDRTLPLAAHANKPELTTGLNCSWDFTDFDASHANGVPWASPAAATLTKTLTIDLVTRKGIPGRHQHTLNAYYKLANIAATGIQTGTADFTVSIVVSTPATMPTTSARMGYLYQTYGGGSASFYIDIGDVAGQGSYVTLGAGGVSPLIATSPANYLAPDCTYVITGRRVGNTFSLHLFNVTTGVYKLQGSGTNTVSLTNANATDLYCVWTKDANSDHVVHSVTHWTTALTDTTIQTVLGADYWSMNANSAGASTLSVTTPANGATIGSTANISGISAGTAPTGVEVQYNGGAWTALSSFSYDSGAGTWSGVVSGLAAGTGTFQARKANEPSTLSSTVTGVTVSADNITIANVPSYRIFQRNTGSNTTNIALSGSYVGVVSSIEWRIGTGAWAALSAASIASGNWAGTAENVPVGTGALQVRVVNNPIITASVPGVSVGDIWICGGQSNMQGRGSTANSYTLGSLLAHKWNAGVWAELTDPYDAASAALGSFIPLLATKMLTAGVPVGFVGCAEGGTAISQWQKNGTYYDRMLSRYNSAGGAARGLLWLQGESDVQNGVSTATYQAALDQMVNDWHTDTGQKTVVFRVHEGGTGTGPQHDAIREAQTLVGTNNVNAVLGPDLYGIEATDVHFLTTSKLQQVADRAWPCIASEFYSMRKASVTLVNKNGVARANLRNVRYAFFDQSTPATLAAPTASGGAVGLGLVADQNGQVKIPLPATTLAAGQTGFLLLSDSTGNAANASNAYAAPVIVS